MDDILFKATTVFDNLIATGEMPVTIGVFVGPGKIERNGKFLRANRSYEFDTTNDRFVRFLLEELLPDAEAKKTTDGRLLNFSKNPNDRAIAGASSGGICAFTAAWERPDAFRRVFSAFGSFVAMRGGNEYPALIRKTEPKPLRIFLEDGTEDAWNPLLGHWFDGNLLMESALAFSGYEVAHSWGHGGHDGVHAENIFPDVMRWLWKGWPKEVECGVSRNDMLSEIIDSQSQWQEIELPGVISSSLFANNSGDIIFQTIDQNIHKLNQDGIQNLGRFSDCSLVGVLYNNLLLLDSSGRLMNDKRDIYPDHSRLVQRRVNSQWIYSYVPSENDLFSDKQPYYRLHSTNDSFASENGNMVFDSRGYLYVATLLGVQVCDREGLVRAILPIPGEQIHSLCLGGKDMNELYVLTEDNLYVRKLNTSGI